MPSSHVHHLTAVLYRALSLVDAEYARQMHDNGATWLAHRFKPFTFSTLRATRRQVLYEDGGVTILPGDACWWVSSALPEFLDRLTEGVLRLGTIRVAGRFFPVHRIERYDAAPDFSQGVARLRCLSPVVALRRDEAGHFVGQGVNRYIYPEEQQAFNEAIRLCLIGKHVGLYGAPPSDDRLRLCFDPLSVQSHKGTMTVPFKTFPIMGAYLPFVARGSEALLRVGYEAGFGCHTGVGFGMTTLQNAAIGDGEEDLTCQR